MNSIASPRRIDAGLPAVGSTRTIAVAIAAALLTVLLVSFKPYQPFVAPGAQSGDIVNQVGFATLGAIGLMAILTLADRRTALSLFGPGWLVMGVFLVLGTATAADPGSTMRTLIFTLSAMSGMAAVVALGRDGDAIARVLLVTGTIVVVASYAGLVVFPDLARHSSDSLEPQHAGLWRGVFVHKNLTGPVMAAFIFAGVYMFRRGWRWRGLLLSLSALVFMANTGSKTTLGLVPLVGLAVMVPGIVGLRRLVPAIFILGMAAGAAATLGIVFVPALKALAGELAPGLTYTGRTQLWSYAGEMIMHRPWTGYGYEAFWGTPLVTESDRYFDQDWDISNIVHGHNGYLDIAVTLGVPALVAAGGLFLIGPCRDFLRTPLMRENVVLADFYMMVVAFSALNALLESFFFRRADPVWLLFFMAVVGLRVTSRRILPSRSR
ncbi:MAG: O-antigen ligase [Rhizobiaceae bacterium]